MEKTQFVENYVHFVELFMKLSLLIHTIVIKIFVLTILL